MQTHQTYQDIELPPEWLTVYRGVPSLEFPELHEPDELATWCTRSEVGENLARWVVPEDEAAFMEVGIVHISDVFDPNWAEGLITIPDADAVDVRELVPVSGCLTFAPSSSESSAAMIDEE